MNHTQNYQLSQWDADDPVLRTDFNADNAKIDAAIAKCGNCRVRVSTYVGDGEASRTHIFEHTPALVFLCGPVSACVIAPGPSGLPNMRMSGNNAINQLTWSEYSFTISNTSTDKEHICNGKDKVYTMVTFEYIDG